MLCWPKMDLNVDLGIHTYEDMLQIYGAVFWWEAGAGLHLYF